MPCILFHILIISTILFMGILFCIQMLSFNKEMQRIGKYFVWRQFEKKWADVGAICCADGGV